jgi:predicted ABC-type sugar transport system permease subunit
MSKSSNAFEGKLMTQAITSSEIPTKPKKRHFSDLLATELRALPIIVGLVALWTFFAFESSVFLTPLNLSNLLVQSTVTGIMALGLLFVLLVKEIDLSIAAINGVTAVLMAKLIVEFGVPPWFAVCIAIVVGAAIGSMSARWVTFIGVPSFVVTLGLGLALNGIQLLLLPRTARYGLMGTGIESIAQTKLYGLSAWAAYVILMAILTILVVSNAIRRRRHGLHVHAVTSVAAPLIGAALFGAVVVAILNAHQGIPLVVLIFAVLPSASAGTYSRRPSSASISMPSAITTKPRVGRASMSRASRWRRSPSRAASRRWPASSQPPAPSASASSPAAASAAARCCSNRSPRRSSAVSACSAGVAPSMRRSSERSSLAPCRTASI